MHSHKGFFLFLLIFFSLLIFWWLWATLSLQIHESVYSIHICRSDLVKTVAGDIFYIRLLFVLFKSLEDSIKREAIDYKKSNRQSLKILGLVSYYSSKGLVPCDILTPIHDIWVLVKQWLWYNLHSLNPLLTNPLPPPPLPYSPVKIGFVKSDVTWGKQRIPTDQLVSGKGLSGRTGITLSDPIWIEYKIDSICFGFIPTDRNYREVHNTFNSPGLLTSSELLGKCD